VHGVRCPSFLYDSQAEHKIINVYLSKQIYFEKKIWKFLKENLLIKFRHFKKYRTSGLSEELDKIQKFSISEMNKYLNAIGIA